MLLLNNLNLLIMKKTTIKHIAPIFAEHFSCCLAESVLYAERACELYNDFGRMESLIDDPTVIEHDLSHGLLSNYSGFGQFARSGQDYSPREEWLWYMEDEGPLCRAISIRTGEILDEDDIYLETHQGEFPELCIGMYLMPDGRYRGEVSVDCDTMPWLTSVLSTIDCRGETPEEVKAAIHASVSAEVNKRYRQYSTVTTESWRDIVGRMFRKYGR